MKCVKLFLIFFLLNFPHDLYTGYEIEKTLLCKTLLGMKTHKIDADNDKKRLEIKSR